MAMSDMLEMNAQLAELQVELAKVKAGLAQSSEDEARRQEASTRLHDRAEATAAALAELSEEVAKLKSCQPGSSSEQSQGEASSELRLDIVDLQERFNKLSTDLPSQILEQLGSRLDKLESSRLAEEVRLSDCSETREDSKAELARLVADAEARILAQAEEAGLPKRMAELRDDVVAIGEQAKAATSDLVARQSKAEAEFQRSLEELESRLSQRVEASATEARSACQLDLAQLRAEVSASAATTVSNVDDAELSARVEKLVDESEARLRKMIDEVSASAVTTASNVDDAELSARVQKLVDEGEARLQKMVDEAGSAKLHTTADAAIPEDIQQEMSKMAENLESQIRRRHENFVVTINKDIAQIEQTVGKHGEQEEEQASKLDSVAELLLTELASARNEFQSGLDEERRARKDGISELSTAFASFAELCGDMQSIGGKAGLNAIAE